MTMQAASLLVAVLGVVMAAASLTWQAASFVLTGGRPKIDLKPGALAADGGSMVLVEPRQFTPDWFKNTASQGFGRPIVAIEVRNVGRLPITVNRWHLATRVGVTLMPIADSIGPDLPHQINVGQSATWAVGLQEVKGVADTAGEVLGDGETTAAVFGRIVLGDGRQRDTPGSIRP